MVIHLPFFPEFRPKFSVLKVLLFSQSDLLLQHIFRQWGWPGPEPLEFPCQRKSSLPGILFPSGLPHKGLCQSILFWLQSNYQSGTQAKSSFLLCGRLLIPELSHIKCTLSLQLVHALQTHSLSTAVENRLSPLLGMLKMAYIKKAYRLVCTESCELFMQLKLCTWTKNINCPKCLKTKLIHFIERGRMTIWKGKGKFCPTQIRYKAY